MRAARLRDRAWLLSGGSGHPWGTQLAATVGRRQYQRQEGRLGCPSAQVTPSITQLPLSSLLSARHSVFLAFSVCHLMLPILHASLNVTSSEKVPVIP